MNIRRCDVLISIETGLLHNAYDIIRLHITYLFCFKEVSMASKQGSVSRSTTSATSLSLFFLHSSLSLSSSRLLMNSLVTCRGLFTSISAIIICRLFFNILAHYIYKGFIIKTNTKEIIFISKCVINTEILIIIQRGQKYIICHNIILTAMSSNHIKEARIEHCTY